jgi:hypothetical protein
MLLMPMGALRLFYPVGDEDEDTAFAILATVPLSKIQTAKSAAVSFSVPSGRHWTRLRRSWGDPGYIIAAVIPPEYGRLKMYCFDSLGITARVHVDGKPVLSTEAHELPYNYSSYSSCQATGITFRARPKSMVDVTFAGTRDMKLPRGDLIITSYFTDLFAEVDAVVVSDDLELPVTIVAAGGLSLLLAAGLLWLLAVHDGK